MKLKKGRRQFQDVLVVLVLLQHSPTLRQGELALVGDAGDGGCVFPTVIVSRTKPPLHLEHWHCQGFVFV